MFYSKYMFVTKGKLAKVWLAAHWEKKLTKTQVLKTNIEDSVGDIIEPVAPLALRVSGQLLVGVSRIYNRKVRYLLEDCNDALSKIKTISKRSTVDLPENAQVAQPDQIRIIASVDDADMFEIPLDELVRVDSEDVGVTRARIQDITLDPRDASIYDDAALLDASLKGDESDLLQPIEEDLLSLPIGSHELDLSLAEFDRLDEPLDFKMPSIEVQLEEDEKSMDKSDIELMRDADSDAGSISSHLPSDISVPGSDMMFMEEEGKEEKPILDLGMQDIPEPLPADVSLPAIEHVDVDVDMVDVEEPKPARRSRKRKHVVAPDQITELSSAYIKEGLRDTSDITHQERPSVLKRAKHDKHISKDDIQALFNRPTFDEALAPELLEMYKSGMAINRPFPPDSDVAVGEREREKESSESEREERKLGVEEQEEHKREEELAKAEVKGDVEEEEAVGLVGPVGPVGLVGGPEIDQSVSILFDDQVPPPSPAPPPPVSPTVTDRQDKQLDFGFSQSLDAEEQMKQQLIEHEARHKYDIEDAGPPTDFFGGEEKVQERDVEEEEEEGVVGGWSKRTKKMYQHLASRYQNDFSFFKMTEGRSRRTVAAVFHELLVLKTNGFVDLQQETSFEDVDVSKTNKFSTPLPDSLDDV